MTTTQQHYSSRFCSWCGANTVRFGVACVKCMTHCNEEQPFRYCNGCGEKSYSPFGKIAHCYVCLSNQKESSNWYWNLWKTNHQQRETQRRAQEQEQNHQLDQQQEEQKQQQQIERLDFLCYAATSSPSTIVGTAQLPTHSKRKQYVDLTIPAIDLTLFDTPLEGICDKNNNHVYNAIVID
jgi:hypothetical protein